MSPKSTDTHLVNKTPVSNGKQSNVFFGSLDQCKDYIFQRAKMIKDSPFTWLPDVVPYVTKEDYVLGNDPNDLNILTIHPIDRD